MAIAGVFLPIVLPIILLDNLCTFKIIPDEQAKTILHLFFFINLFAYSIYTGALIFLFSKIIAGDQWNVAECLRTGLNNFPNILAITVISGMLIMLGFMLFIVPGIIISARLSFAAYHIILDGETPIGALKRSYEATRQYMWKIVLSSLIFSIPMLLIFFLIHRTYPSIFYLNIFTGIATDIGFDILSVIFAVLIFRFYSFYKEALEHRPASP